MSSLVFTQWDLVLWGVVGALWLVSAALAARRERAARCRAAAVLGERSAEGRARGRPPWMRDDVRGWLAAAGAVSAGWALVGGVPGVLLGVGAGCGVLRWWRGRAAAGDPGFDAAEASRQLPLAADLLAACVAAGAGPVVAARAVGEALEGPVGERLAHGAAEMRLGSEPADAWRRLGTIPGAGPLARLLERAGESGAPAAEPVARLAADCRADRARAATAAARRAGVLMTAPVGLCFLPAFIAVGVLPVVIGLAEGLLSGG
ncbi:type II secretion system F family protein [Streptomyces sp. NPDC050658]|uniref:type II secretion system F family protein n=1 Tax=unclassified Streptomyces TaxID=2593676 RepID=UPI003435F4E4